MLHPPNKHISNYKENLTKRFTCTSPQSICVRKDLPYADIFVVFVKNKKCREKAF
jgi:hypothetical protein